MPLPLLKTDTFRKDITIVEYFQFHLLHRNVVILWVDLSHSNDPRVVMLHI